MRFIMGSYSTEYSNTFRRNVRIIVAVGMNCNLRYEASTIMTEKTITQLYTFHFVALIQQVCAHVSKTT